MLPDSLQSGWSSIACPKGCKGNALMPAHLADAYAHAQTSVTCCGVGRRIGEIPERGDPGQQHLQMISAHVSAYITHVRTQLKQTIPKAIVHCLVSICCPSAVFLQLLFAVSDPCHFFAMSSKVCRCVLLLVSKHKFAGCIICTRSDICLITGWPIGCLNLSSISWTSCLTCALLSHDGCHDLAHRDV